MSASFRSDGRACCFPYGERVECSGKQRVVVGEAGREAEGGGEGGGDGEEGEAEATRARSRYLAGARALWRDQRRQGGGTSRECAVAYRSRVGTHEAAAAPHPGQDFYVAAALPVRRPAADDPGVVDGPEGGSGPSGGLRAGRQPEGEDRTAGIYKTIHARDSAVECHVPCLALTWAV